MRRIFKHKSIPAWDLRLYTVGELANHIGTRLKYSLFRLLVFFFEGQLHKPTVDEKEKKVHQIPS